MTNSVTREALVAAPLSRVWRAVSDHREFGAWFQVSLDGPFAEGATVGGTMIHPKGEGLPFEARVVAVRPETYLAFEWPAYAPEQGVLRDEPWTLVEFRLASEGGGTRVAVTESGFDRLPTRVRDRVRRENEGGWQEQMGNLAAYAAS